jgi:hypothetical protein
MPISVGSHLLPIPVAAITSVAADSATASALPPREAELLDMLASSGLEPTLAAAAPTLTFLAVARPDRASLGA